MYDRNAGASIVLTLFFVVLVVVGMLVWPQYNV